MKSKNMQMGDLERRFADIIWENEPISSSELSKISEELLGWKKTTSFTVLHRLQEKGIFKNVRGTVTSLMSKEEFKAIQSEQFVTDQFEGSLPAFIAAFSSRQTLTEKDVRELQRIIDAYEENNS